jgi:hypothetical protein
MQKKEGHKYLSSGWVKEINQFLKRRRRMKRLITNVIKRTRK